MAKIRILHIIKSLGRGGAEMLLPETLKLHDQGKFEFHYIYFLPWKDQMVESLQNEGGIVNCFKATNNVHLIFTFKDIIDYCKSNKIDLIHCHLPWAGFVGRLVYKITGIPLFYTEHNMQERYHWITKYINKYSFNSQTLALGVSHDVTSSITSNINPKIPVKTVLNGVNTETFTKKGNQQIKEELGIPNDGLVIGNVAVFRFQKRLVEWLRVFKKISDKHPKVYGIIVGAGPLEEKIKNECFNLGLENKVFFPGLRTNVKPYFQVMDIFMMSSSFEGLPIALLEAMSMECAIVTTDAGGIKEVIRNNKDGLVCRTDEWKKLEFMVEDLIKTPEQLEKLKNAARLRVQKNFSLKRMVEELEYLYEKEINLIS